MIVGWLALATAALLALGGAASAPGGILLGAPRIPWAAVVLVALAGVVFRAGWPSGSVGLGLLPLLVLVLSGLRAPEARALTGPPLVAPVLAAVILALGSRRRPLPSWVFPAVVLVVHLTMAWRLHVQVGPNGDEPHYLMVADSLLRDGDLAVETDFKEGRYRAFHPGPLEPDYLVRGRGGVIYSLHAVGLSLLILPAYALGGYTGVALFMGFLTTLVAWETRALLRDVLGGEDRVAGGTPEAVAWVVALSPPLLPFAGLVFTEVPAALVVAFVLRHGRRLAHKPAWVAFSLALAVSFLPWLNVRYVPVSVVLLLYLLWHRFSRSGALSVVGPAVASAVAIGLYHFALYGFVDPRLVYGRRHDLSLLRIPEGVAGILFDQEFGLLVYAPIYAFALVGFAFLLRRSRAIGLAALAVAFVTLAMTGSWVMWRGGWNPPARFLVPVVSALALAVGAALPRGLTAPAALLAGWSLFAGLGGAFEPRLVHRDRDGTAPFFRELSGAEEWTHLLPGYVRPETAGDRGPLTAVWGLALLVATLPRRRGQDRAPRDAGGRLVLAIAGMLAAAGVASRASSGRAGGREAVRVVGRPAIEVPRWSATSAAGAQWGPEVLSWGPVYEPHRHPGGAVIGDRLPLPPGRYAVLLRGERFDAAVPEMSVQASPALEPGPPGPLRADVDGLAGVIVVPPGQRETTLRLCRGGAMRLDRVELRRVGF